MMGVNGDVLTPVPFIQTEFSERGAIFSPDGRWVAYVSDKSGQNDVYARPYPGPGAEATISVGGGSEPVWGPRGDRLYYRRENELVVVDVEHTAQSLNVGPPRRVMEDRYLRDTSGGNGGMANYDVDPSGDRFVVGEQVAQDSATVPAHIYLVLNWAQELEERVPAK